MTIRIIAAAGALALAVLPLSGCATAAPTASKTQTASHRDADIEAANFKKDRQAILAMAGNYHVTFDFIETVAFEEGYELKDRKLSGGKML